jgi:hypothetical protein
MIKNYKFEQNIEQLLWREISSDHIEDSIMIGACHEVIYLWKAYNSKELIGKFLLTDFIPLRGYFFFFTSKFTISLW